jgi:hypothetical protein
MSAANRTRSLLMASSRKRRSACFCPVISVSTATAPTIRFLMVIGFALIEMTRDDHLFERVTFFV